MKIKAKVRMGRYMNAGEKHYLNIEDEASGNEFLRLEFDAKQLSNLMSTAIATMEGEIRGLDTVGKEYIREPMTLIIPDGLYDYGNKDKVKEWLAEYEKSDEFTMLYGDWKIDKYLGSQSSIVRAEDGIYVANVARYKYVEKEGE